VAFFSPDLVNGLKHIASRMDSEKHALLSGDCEGAQQERSRNIEEFGHCYSDEKIDWLRTDDFPALRTIHQLMQSLIQERRQDARDFSCRLEGIAMRVTLLSFCGDDGSRWGSHAVISPLNKRIIFLIGNYFCLDEKAKRDEGYDGRVELFRSFQWGYCEPEDHDAKCSEMKSIYSPPSLEKYPQLENVRHYLNQLLAEQEMEPIKCPAYIEEQKVWIALACSESPKGGIHKKILLAPDTKRIRCLMASFFQVRSDAEKGVELKYCENEADIDRLLQSDAYQNPVGAVGNCVVL